MDILKWINRIFMIFVVMVWSAAFDVPFFGLIICGFLGMRWAHLDNMEIIETQRRSRLEEYRKKADNE